MVLVSVVQQLKSVFSFRLGRFWFWFWLMSVYVFLTEGKLVHSMVAHLDSVTCLAVDPNGLYLMSGSESSCFQTMGVLVSVTMTTS